MTAPSDPPGPIRKRGRPRATDAAHQATRERICAAALTLFERGGIDAIAMREIAAAIGVSPMMPYKYYPTKDHLLQELRSRSFAQLEAAMRAGRDGGETAPARLRGLLAAYLRFGLEESNAYRLMFDYWTFDDRDRLLEDFGDAIRRQSGAWGLLLEEVRAWEAAFGLDGDPMTTAHLIWSAVHGLVSLEAARKLVMGRRFEDLAAPMVERVLALLGPETGSRPR